MGRIFSVFSDYVPHFLSFLPLFLLFCFLFILFSIPLYAHKGVHERDVELYVGREKIELRVMYRIPPGERAFTIRKKFDFNKDGFIDDNEFEAMKNSLALEAVKGFRITFQGRRVNIYATKVFVDTARESDSSLEISVSLTIPIWLAPAPPPPDFKVGLMEEKFDHTHIVMKADFKPEFIKGKMKPSEDGNFWLGTLKRFSPLIIRFKR